jgi:hypothetical protein
MYQNTDSVVRCVKAAAPSAKSSVSEPNDHVSGTVSQKTDSELTSVSALKRLASRRRQPMSRNSRNRIIRNYLNFKRLRWFIIIHI